MQTSNVPSRISQLSLSVTKARSAADVVQMSRGLKPLSVVYEQSREITSAAIKAVFSDFNRFMDVNKGLSDEHIDYIAQELTEGSHGKQLNFADILFVLDQAKKGKYGELYESITPAKIFGWFDEYIEHRMDAYEIMAVNEQKERSKGKIDDASILDWYRRNKEKDSESREKCPTNAQTDESRLIAQLNLRNKILTEKLEKANEEIRRLKEELEETKQMAIGLMAEE